MTNPSDGIQEHLEFLYGEERAGPAWDQIAVMLKDFRQRNPALSSGDAVAPLSERDTILITYGDQFREPEVPLLQTLHKVLTETLDQVVTGVHILPFFPYSSDDGFSVIDYTEVNPDLGTWAHVERLGQDFRLMFDAVINHISRESAWFQSFLEGGPEYQAWFITFDPEVSQDWVSDVVRPRALPLLTPVQTANGKKLVWTTFSDDQIDLNYAHPPVLLKILEVMLLYVEEGAEIIRLDAIAYLWKEPGTSCIHLEETHRVVKLMRAVLDAVAPEVILITETNVPHEENISYFGQPMPGTGRTDEAQLVYQFPLAPLAMHSILSGSAEVLSAWAADLQTPAPQAAFFNFTASHDGIGLMPARGLLSETEIQSLVDTALAHGGRASYKTNADGSRSVYELNISYFDALSDPAADEPQAVQVARFVVSQAIMLALAGLPGIYVHSLLGSRSWQEGVERTGHNRAINREKLERATVEEALADPASVRHQVFAAYKRLLRARSSSAAFDPYGGQRVLDLNPHVFALLRSSPEGKEHALCLHNVSDQKLSVDLGPALADMPEGDWFDLQEGRSGAPPLRPGKSGSSVELEPYAVRWLGT